MERSTPHRRTREPAVAGTFYPSDPVELARDVDALLADAATRVSAIAPPKALIVPHAGYVYSGPIAATAYATLKPIAKRIRRVVLLGPAHRVHLRGWALPDADAIKTPLGVVPIDANRAGIVAHAAAHAHEHSLEVQIPFLQCVLGEFSITPIVVGAADLDALAAVIDGLWGGEETLVLISSDLSHYLTSDVAHRLDRSTADQIVGLTATDLSHDLACGATPVSAFERVAARRAMKASTLDLRNSADTAGTPERVVGYGAFAFHA